MTDTREQVERLIGEVKDAADYKSVDLSDLMYRSATTLRALLSRLEAAGAERNAAVAAAHEAAARACEKVKPDFGDHRDYRNAVLRLTPADALTALDRVRQEIAESVALPMDGRNAKAQAGYMRDVIASAIREGK
jgi:hypothetical protein